MSKLALLGLLISLGSPAFGTQLLSRELRSSQGVKVRFDYQLVSEVSNSNKPSSNTYAQSLFVSVTGTHLRPTDKIRVVLINNENFRGQCGQPTYSLRPHYLIDLDYVGGLNSAFAGTFERAKLLLDGREVELQPQHRRLRVNSNAYCQQTYTNQEVAVVVNGEWQRDPVNGTHNFRLSLY